MSLASVDFMSSTALGKLITLNRKVTAMRWHSQAIEYEC